MARSIVLRSKGQKKSPPVSAVARRQLRRGRSSGSPLSNDDAPYRNLRRRVSIEAKQAADKKSPRVQTRTSMDSVKQGRKRAKAPVAADAPSLPVKEPKTKKRKTPSSLSVAVTQPESAPQPPLTRSQRQKLNQVTPSPTHNPASPSFSFSSPQPTRNATRVFEMSSKVPKGVVDIYPSRPIPHNCGTGHCTCREDVCSSRSLSAEFIRVYGEEYTQILKYSEDGVINHEEDIIMEPPSPDVSTTSSQEIRDRHHTRDLDHLALFRKMDAEMAADLASPAPSCDSSCCGHSSPSSQHTPTIRRVWQSLNTAKLAPVRAVESTDHMECQPDLTPKMRAILIDWIIELSEHFNFGHSTLHLACTLVDHVLAHGPMSFDDEEDDECRWEADDGEESRTNCFLISRDRFQLLGATCTWLACKMEEQSPPPVSQIAYVSDNIYGVEQIKRMERRVCKALNFGLFKLTPYQFIFEFTRASCECIDPGCELPPVFHNMVLYLLELGRLPYTPATKLPSALTAAAVYLARVTLGVPGGPWTKTLEYYTGYEKEHLKEIVLSIHTYQVAAEDSNLKSVYSKYKAKKYRRVALKTAPREEDLGF